MLANLKGILFLSLITMLFSCSIPTNENKSDYVSVSSIAISNTSVSLLADDIFTLTCNIFPINATIQTVSWSSSNDSIATVTDGQITAKSAGTAIITVTTTDSRISATCSITITNKPVWLLTKKQEYYADVDIGETYTTLHNEIIYQYKSITDYNHYFYEYSISDSKGIWLDLELYEINQNGLQKITQSTYQGYIASTNELISEQVLLTTQTSDPVFNDVFLSSVSSITGFNEEGEIDSLSNSNTLMQYIGQVNGLKKFRLSSTYTYSNNGIVNSGSSSQYQFVYFDDIYRLIKKESYNAIDDLYLSYQVFTYVDDDISYFNIKPSKIESYIIQEGSEVLSSTLEYSIDKISDSKYCMTEYTFYNGIKDYSAYIIYEYQLLDPVDY